jgi:hypothetical protein
VSAYRVAIDQTAKAIDTRARYYRNLIVAVVALALGSIGCAAVTWTVPPLASILLLIPACGFFFFLDGRLLDHWRSRLVDTWIKKDIDFAGLCKAVNAIPTLPKDTLRSMLATLPRARDLVAEQGISSSTREAVAAAMEAFHACQSDTLAWKAAASAIVAFSVVVAAAWRRWEPLLGFLASVLLPLLTELRKRHRIEVLKRKTAAARARPDFSDDKYRELVGGLQWDPISGSEKGIALRN